MNKGIVLTLFAVLVAPQALAGDITGFWKHAEEPGWIEIQVVEGEGTGRVVRNDLYPGRVGREILKSLTADASREGVWHGQVYAERLGEYKDAEIRLKDKDSLQMKVKMGFISRSVYWIRVDEILAEPGVKIDG